MEFKCILLVYTCCRMKWQGESIIKSRDYWPFIRTHCSFSLPPENIRKTLRFSNVFRGRERAYWEQMGYSFAELKRFCWCLDSSILAQSISCHSTPSLTILCKIQIAFKCVLDTVYVLYIHSKWGKFIHRHEINIFYEITEEMFLTIMHIYL